MIAQKDQLFPTGLYMLDVALRTVLSPSRGLLTQQELARLKDAMERDQVIHDNAYGRSDARGMRTRVCLWNNLPDNVAGAIARSEKVVNTVEEVQSSRPAPASTLPFLDVPCRYGYHFCL